MPINSKVFLLPLFALLFSFTISHINLQEEKKPVIGILTSPSDFQHMYDPREFSYIKNSYADFLEAAGAIPVAIPWDLPERDIVSLLNSINGVLFTGGDASLWDHDEDSSSIVFSNFTKRSAFIFNHVVELNNKGIHYPLFGICQGHETILMSLRGSPDIIDHYKHPGQLDTVNIKFRGRLFESMPDHLVEHIRSEHSMFYNHKFGFNVSILEEVPSLGEFFTLTAVDVDDNGKEFIAAMEAKYYPIYTVQYHPEKIISEWMNNNTHFKHHDHAAQAVMVQAQYFVNQAKKNMHLHRFEDEDIFERFKLVNHEHEYFNITWPKVFFYDKKSPISYHVNPDWEDNLPLDEIEEHVQEYEIPYLEL